MQCRICGFEGNPEKFRKAVKRKHGRDKICHACNRNLIRGWRSRNAEWNRRRDRAYYAEHREKALEASSQWRLKNPDYHKRRLQFYRDRNTTNPPDPTQGKWCCNCKKFQPLKNFYRNISTPDGRVSRCIPCERQRIRQKTRGPRRLLEALLEEQGYLCNPNGIKPGCGRDLRDMPRHEVHVDHIIPQSKGGTNHRSNLQALCAACNLGWGDTIPPAILNSP